MTVLQAQSRHEGDGPTPIAGLLVIDKPIGPTSMDVCRRIRGRLKAGGAPKRIKVGHGGTLDPLASGVLVVLVGKATKLCEQIMAGEKRYLTEIDLSVWSPTDDLESEPVAVDAPAPSEDEIRDACTRFVGTIQQVPPAHSAVHVGGRRAYDLARSGEEVKLEPRTVVVHSCEPVLYQWPKVELDIRCGKGVYIRSIARDLGRALTGGGVMTALRRTGVGRFGIEDARPFDGLPDPLTRDDLDPVPSPGTPPS
ncbi:MAG: tRNA pseudouridine(55) synthase TruB [Planctomycetota bacterium]